MRYRRLQLEGLFLGRRLLPPRQHLSMLDAPERNIPLINAFRPGVIHSYGSYLEALFARLHATGEPFHRPAAVGFGGDGLSDQARRMIGEEFGIPAFSLYSSVEAPSIAFECGEHRGLHVNEDVYPLRVVDASGRGLPPGEEGEVVVSNLVNRAMVLLNYNLGDLAALLPGPCPCGRVLPLMSFPSGRADDWLERASGERVHPSAVYPLFREEAAVLQFQVAQSGPSGFDVSLVTAASFRRAEAEARLRAGFIRVFGNAVRLRFSYVASVPRTAAGKVRAVVSRKAGGAENAT
jgi:phenylacetate-CoA ligase